MAQRVEAAFGLASLPRPGVDDLARRHAIAILESEPPLEPLPLYAS